MSATTIALLKADEGSFVFEELFHTHYEMVYHYALKKTKSVYLAEEATQLTFIKLWQYRANLSEEFSFETQLFRITRTTIIDLVKKQYTQDKIIYNKRKEPVILPDSIWEKVTEHELQKQLLRGIEAMPAVRKKVFRMSRFEDKTNREIASELSISVKAVEYHITKALQFLKQLLVVMAAIHLLG